MSLFPLDTHGMCVRLVKIGAAVVAASIVAGCGSTYRPVVTPINPSGPAQQPQSLVAVVSSSSPSSPGIATIIDYAGDTVMAEAQIGPGPVEFSVDESGSTGYTVDSDGTLTNFTVSTTLRTDPTHVTFSTLPATAEPVALFSLPVACGQLILRGIRSMYLQEARRRSSWQFLWRRRRSPLPVRQSSLSTITPSA